MKPEEIPVEFKERGRRLIESYMDKKMYWDPWSNDLHHELGLELLRQMSYTLKCAAEATRQIGPEDSRVPKEIWEQWATIIETCPLVLAPDDWTP